MTPQIAISFDIYTYISKKTNGKTKSKLWKISQEPQRNSPSLKNHLTENLTDNIRIEAKPRRCRKQKETVSDSTFTFFWFRGQIPEIMKIVKPVVYVKMHFILKQLVHAYQDAWDPGLPTLTLSLKHWSWQNKSIPGELHSATLMGDLKVVGTHSIYFLLLQIIYLSSHLNHTQIGPLLWY